MVGRRSAIAAAVILLLSGRAEAHGFHAAFTVIEIDAQSGVMHVIHRLFTQDVETLIKARTNAAVTVRSGAAFDAALESYLRSAFTLRTDTGAILPLTWIRTTVADDLVAVYFDAAGAAPKSLAVDNQLLMETNPDQVNTVNVTLDGDTRTVVFRDGDAPQVLRF